MNFNKSLKVVNKLFKHIEPKDWKGCLEDLFTPVEIEGFAERIALLQQLKKGKTQRDIAEHLGISVTTVSRGSRILKYGTGKLIKYI